MKGLEAVVERLESGEPPLEESIRLFEEGDAPLRDVPKAPRRGRPKIELLLRKPGGVSRETAEEDDILGKERVTAADTIARLRGLVEGSLVGTLSSGSSRIRLPSGKRWNTP